MVMLDQNRVDIVFEITEGPKSKVRQINIIGNKEFSDTVLRSEMVKAGPRVPPVLRAPATIPIASPSTSRSCASST
jgi:hypothetical protein